MRDFMTSSLYTYRKGLLEEIILAYISFLFFVYFRILLIFQTVFTPVEIF